MQYLSQNARFSRCKTYRYSLERRWDNDKGKVVFIGLNPSTADHRQDDPTIRRCVRFANDWGYGAMEIVNLFAYRATLPKDLKLANEPIGKANGRWIRRALEDSDLGIACWGNDGNYLNQDQKLLRRFPDLFCIAKNQSNTPSHPLYLKANLKPSPLQQQGR